MRQVDPKIYNKDYYLNYCCGSEEFKSKGEKIHPRILSFVKMLKPKKGEVILDLGCGRGDLVIELAKNGIHAVGVDYSSDGIRIANSYKNKKSQKIKKNAEFFKMDAKKLKFKDNYFDKIISVDVFEHLYKQELEIALGEIKRVLKPKGLLIVHTETNKTYLDFTHKYYSQPLDSLFIKLNKLFFKNDYPPLPKDPRNEFHKKQHVNEPTYFYLKSLFKRHSFNGKILIHMPYKPNLSWKDTFYNVPVYLYPISKYFPLHLFFGQEYICIMRNKKK